MLQGLSRLGVIHSKKHENSKTPGLNIQHENAKTRKRRNRKNAKTTKTQKGENGENAKTCKAGKPFLQKTKNTTANRTSNQRRTEMGKTQQDENAKTRKTGTRKLHTTVLKRSQVSDLHTARSTSAARSLNVLVDCRRNAQVALLACLAPNVPKALGVVGWLSSKGEFLSKRAVFCCWNCVIRILLGFEMPFSSWFPLTSFDEKTLNMIRFCHTVFKPNLTRRGSTTDGDSCEVCKPELQVLWVWGLRISKKKKN